MDDPFDTVSWEIRSAAIKGEKGEVVFEQKELREYRPPGASWPQTSSVSKYFYGENGTDEREYQRPAS